MYDSAPASSLLSESAASGGRSPVELSRWLRRGGPFAGLVLLVAAVYFGGGVAYNMRVKDAGAGGRCDTRADHANGPHASRLRGSGGEKLYRTRKCGTSSRRSASTAGLD
jgi:hypothetical protein